MQRPRDGCVRLPDWTGALRPARSYNPKKQEFLLEYTTQKLKKKKYVFVCVIFVLYLQTFVSTHSVEVCVILLPGQKKKQEQELWLGERLMELSVERH